MRIEKQAARTTAYKVGNDIARVYTPSITLRIVWVFGFSLVLWAIKRDENTRNIFDISSKGQFRLKAYKCQSKDLRHIFNNWLFCNHVVDLWSMKLILSSCTRHLEKITCLYVLWERLDSRRIIKLYNVVWCFKMIQYLYESTLNCDWFRYFFC